MRARDRDDTGAGLLGQVDVDDDHPSGRLPAGAADHSWPRLPARSRSTLEGPGRVQRKPRRADPQHRKDRDRQLRAAVQLDGDGVGRPCAGHGEPAGELRGPGGQVGIPDHAVARQVGRRLRVGGDPGLEQVEDTLFHG